MDSLPTSQDVDNGSSEDEPSNDESSNDDSSKEPEILADLITTNLETSLFEERPQKFLPLSHLDSLITEKSVRDTLKLSTKDRRAAKLVRWICEEARKLFVVVVQTFTDKDNLMLSAMKKFKNANFADKDLPAPPFQWNSARADKSGWRDERFPKTWSLGSLVKFHDMQWRVLAPIFEEEKFHYDLDPNTILPIIWKEDRHQSGNFSKVFKAELHKLHQKYQSVYTTVAIKKFSLDEDEDTIEGIHFWDQEARILNDSNKLNHRHMIKCLAAIKLGKERYFMFPWADGGTLKAFWKDFPYHSRRPDVIRHTIEQLRGLVDALCGLHYYKEGMTKEGDGGGAEIDEEDSIRHGDLKPENILCFFVGVHGEKIACGVLKIADLGLAKRHVVNTRDRGHATSTHHGTRQYEPPEVETTLAKSKDPVSRRYDVWSMGCIILEFIIWILYGNKGLEQFYTLITDQNGPRYFSIYGPPGARKAEVHQVVEQWMNYIQNSDPECKTPSAIRDLLKLVRERLLVVDIYEDLSLSSAHVRIDRAATFHHSKITYRADAKELRDGLDNILHTIQEKEYAGEEYLLIARDLPDHKVSLPEPDASLRTAHQGSHLLPDGLGTGPALHGKQGVAINYGLRDATWDYPIELRFPREVFKSLMADKLPIVTPAEKATLCDRCRNLDFWSGGFSIRVKKHELQDNSVSPDPCDFCAMMLGVCNNLGIPDKALFSRYNSTLKVAGSVFGSTKGIILRSAVSTPNEPCLSLVTSDKFEISQMQLGFPQLPQFPERGALNLSPDERDKLEARFFKVIQMWLKDCDENHPNCRPAPKTRRAAMLPTRLINVGQKGDKISLYETTAGDQQEYSNSESDQYSFIALSHPWGDTKAFKPFMTTRQDSDDFKEEIPYRKLPDTFEHAIQVTRALGKHYLWIDSLCILQGPDGDFSQEAERMEHVFSSAYCVIAASRAENQHSGFLKERNQRKYLRFENNAGESFFVCEAIDNFKRDVEDGNLNQRGWVLQERALARRTVFFAPMQTYFECGEGVRCETLSKLTQTREEFLGDPNFPQKAIAKNKGEKIRDFQELFKLYSGLKFTNPTDRPIAITGLENRLRRAYVTEGGYGIFDDGPDRGLFHRSLLWKCAERGGMRPIDFSAAPMVRAPPSWSWMGSLGQIDYVEVPGNKFDWEKEDIHPPWTRPGTNTSRRGRKVETELSAKVRQFQHDFTGIEKDREIIFDDSKSRPTGQILQCVVIARKKPSSDGQEKTRYILVVEKVGKCGPQNTDTLFKRIGVGYVPAKLILWDRQATDGKIG